MKTTTDPRIEAKSLYWQAYSIPQIAQRLRVSANTIYSWRRRDAWDAATFIERAVERTEVRYLRLIEKEDLSAQDYKTIDLLGRQMARLSRDERKEKQLEKKEKAPKNHFSAEQVAELRALVMESLYEHQKRWYKQRNLRNRFILKSRQIGASWYFAREALLRALETGTNQIFLSASRAQAFQFKKFIIFLARSIGVELKGGDEIILSNGATLYFLGTSAASAQSYTGDLYFDEAFWVANFLNLRKVAAGMATHVGLRRTYFSTPSSEEHEAYEFWSGNLFNSGRGKKDRAELDLSHKALKDGKLCGDNIWRQIVTVHDVIDQGFTLIDLEEIQNENSPDEFDNLYRCIFVKQGERAFNYNALIGCGVDGYSGIWPDWNPYAPRPLGNRKVWIGYDPNGNSDKGDSAGLVVLAPPMVPGGKFRVIERHQLRGMEFEEQANFIKQLTHIYDVQHIDIDGTGIGEAVYQLVVKFFPAAQKHTYTPAVKRQLVLKAQMVIRAGRFEYDAGMMDVVTSFMTIRKFITQGGQTSYASDRKRGSSHGDLAWATMHALQNEPLGNDAGSGTESFVEEF
ncbi:terminase large subunit domain-containing protein [Rouxiella badensis]|uniref:terminase large subunit domain-containing protein n=1 Tax=Rouxiella badensis TaxID=1646377 RepID=UPI00178795D9|nr:terminase family protein [Rouxiella badensis]QOI56222.1 oxidoreductase [Rouxiella badensis subsp. acadiensis]